MDMQPSNKSQALDTHDRWLEQTANDRLHCIECEATDLDTHGDAGWQEHHGEQFCPDCIDAEAHLLLCSACSEGRGETVRDADECECCHGRNCEHHADAADFAREARRDAKAVA